VREAIVVVRHRGRVLLLKRADGMRWAGMWDFPRLAVPVDANSQHSVMDFLTQRLKSLFGFHVEQLQHIATVRHTVTRFRITLDCYEAVHIASGLRRSVAQQRWVKPAELGRYPLSMTGRRLAQLIQHEGPAFTAANKNGRRASTRRPWGRLTLLEKADLAAYQVKIPSTAKRSSRSSKPGDQ